MTHPQPLASSTETSSGANAYGTNACAQPCGLIATLKADFRINSAWKILPESLRRTGNMAVFLFRLASTLYAAQRFGFLARPLGVILTRLNTTLTGVDIQPIARIGAGLTIPHSVGLTIGPVTIGKNATLFHGVTIARAHHTDDFTQSPRLGDNIIVYCGACIIGRISIGDNARVGANAVVTRDVPSGALAIGIPAKIIGPSTDEQSEASKQGDNA